MYNCSDGVCLPKSPFLWWSPAVLGMVEDLTVHRKKGMNSLVCFACVCSFFFPY